MADQDRTVGRLDAEGMVRGQRTLKVAGPDGREQVHVEDALSWFELRCSIDDGSAGWEVRLMDAVRLERAVRAIPSSEVRAATLLKMHGFDDYEIGALLGRRGRHETGTELVDKGVRWVRRYERLQREASGGFDRFMRKDAA